MAIVRTYICDACGCRFDKLHFDRSEPAPECPGCQALESKQAPSGFSIGNPNLNKAVAITQDIMEKDYGLSNFKDRVKPGETHVITLPHIQKQVDQMWAPPGDIIAAAKVGAAQAAAEGRNPFTLTQKAAKMRGTARPPISVVSRG